MPGRKGLMTLIWQSLIHPFTNSVSCERSLGLYNSKAVNPLNRQSQIHFQNRARTDIGNYIITTWQTHPDEFITLGKRVLI